MEVEWHRRKEELWTTTSADGSLVVTLRQVTAWEPNKVPRIGDWIGTVTRVDNGVTIMSAAETSIVRCREAVAQFLHAFTRVQRTTADPYPDDGVPVHHT